MEEVSNIKPVAYFGLNAKELADQKVYDGKIASFVKTIKEKAIQ